MSPRRPARGGAAAHERAPVGPPLYIAHTMPGLETIAGDEVRARLEGARLQGFKHLPQRNGLALFDYAGDPADLLKLRTAEDVFVVAARLPKAPWGFEGLSAMYEALSASPVWDAAVAMMTRLQPAHKGPRRFRVIARLVGPNQPYRRSDFAQSVSKAVERRTRDQWRSVDEGEDVEVWASLVGLDFLVALRLSTADMRHRAYQEQHLEAALRPSVAAALAWLTRPAAEDVFLDAFCGTGTVLIERALAGRHRLLLGGDLSATALAAAAANLGPRHKPRHLLRWNAIRLPLASGSVNATASNLPFGVQMGTPRQVQTLYQGYLRELARVMAPGGRAALLAGQGDLLAQLAGQSGDWTMQRLLPITLLGQRASVSVLRRER